VGQQCSDVEFSAVVCVRALACAADRPSSSTDVSVDKLASRSVDVVDELSTSLSATLTPLTVLTLLTVSW